MTDAIKTKLRRKAHANYKTNPYEKAAELEKRADRLISMMATNYAQALRLYAEASAIRARIAQEEER